MCFVAVSARIAQASSAFSGLAAGVPWSRTLMSVAVLWPGMLLWTCNWEYPASGVSEGVENDQQQSIGVMQYRCQDFAWIGLGMVVH